MNHIRQERILNYIEEKNVVSIKELQALCPEVSLMTIHRDLQALENQGILGGLKTEHGVLWCATEKVAKEELDRAAAIVKEVLGA